MRVLDQCQIEGGEKMPDHSPINITSRSPVKKRAEEDGELLSFYEALRAVSQGHTITKLEWGDREINCLMMDGRLTIKSGTLHDGQYHSWIISDGDLAGDDWVIL
jgi:hypothetical protein